jgi:hypothetical protein
MAQAVLRLRHKTPASWLPHWPTCMSVISREDSMDVDLRFRATCRIASAI